MPAGEKSAVLFTLFRTKIKIILDNVNYDPVYEFLESLNLKYDKRRAAVSGKETILHCVVEDMSYKLQYNSEGVKRSLFGRNMG